AKNRAADIRETLIIEYSPLVKIIAGRLSIYLGYNVEYEDLVSYGIFGLIDAIDKFDYGKGIKFETYASLRIRGAILDQIRKMDWVPRTLRQKQKRMDAALLKLEKELGRPATDQEMAAELGITIEEFYSWENQSKASGLVSLDEFLEQGTEVRTDSSEGTRYDSPDAVVEKKELKELLKAALEILTEKEKNVILLYYYEELTLKEISSIMEVSESRISQLHTKALQKMKTKLGGQFGILYGI
ncbi:MAG: FliA/WhiG family RNA polymerase sigma factor, partial [Lachnospiraceae bacterium]|nr:FliA/WhiG family RNA polymerase sigma factor [Lachnospiraceae bacterium]